jgi:hypothetical protein
MLVSLKKFKPSEINLLVIFSSSPQCFEVPPFHILKSGELKTDSAAGPLGLQPELKVI